MELVFILAIVFFQMFFVNFLQIVKIVRAFRVDTFVYDEVFAILLMHQRMVTVRTTKYSHFGGTVLLRREGSFTNFAQDLSFITVIAVKIWFRSIAERAGAVIGDVAFLTPCNGFDLYVIAVFKVRDQQTPVPFVVKIFDLRELIGFEFLVLGRV